MSEFVTEKQMLILFRPYRQHFEWFHLTPRLKRIIDTICKEANGCR